MSESPSSFATLFRDGTASIDSPDRRGLPEVQVLHLRETLQRYRTENPFTPGDLVTPRRDATLQGAGDPHLVLDCIRRILPSFASDGCCREKRFDMRVAWVFRNGTIATLWVESFEFEPWAPPTKAAAERHPVEPESQTASPWAATAEVAS